MKIHVETIPHAEQRYPTAGDYWQDDTEAWQFRVSMMGNEKYEVLVLIHELVEWFLVRVMTDVSIETIDDFDKAFEKDRAQGLHTHAEEPGNDPSCPYRVQHLIATGVEKILAALAGVDWNAYGVAVESL